jgi:hypothetical protein
LGWGGNIGQIARMCRSVAQPTAGPGDVNHGLFDVFSLVHLGGGIFFGAIGLGFFPMLALAVGWEFAERVLKDCIPHVFVHPAQDTIVNACGDILMAMAGWGIGRAGRDLTRRRRQARPRKLRASKSGFAGRDRARAG